MMRRKLTLILVGLVLPYAADPRFVVEGSVQIPVIRHTGPLVLQTDLNVLLGVKYLF